MKHNQRVTDSVLEGVLELYDKGVPVSDILKKFPEHATALEDYFSIINKLGNERDAVISPRALLHNIVQEIHPQKRKRWNEFAVAWQLFVPVGIAAVLMILFVSKRADTPIPLPAVPLSEEQIRIQEPAPPDTLQPLQMKASGPQVAGPIEDRVVGSLKMGAAREDSLAKEEAVAATSPEPDLIQLHTLYDPSEF